MQELLISTVEMIHFNIMNKINLTQEINQYTLAQSSMKHMKYSLQFLTLFIALAVLIGCHRDEDEGLSAYIDGYAVEEATGEKIPYAYITIGGETSVNFSQSSYQVIDTLRADANGYFRLERGLYKDIKSECGCRLFTCADGPDTPEGADFYDDNCNLTYFDPASTKRIYSKVKTMGYVTLHAVDVLPLNNNYTGVFVSINSSFYSEGISAYPNIDFDPIIGQTFGPYLNHTELFARIQISNSNGQLLDLEQTQNISVLGKDTIHVFFEY